MPRSERKIVHDVGSTFCFAFTRFSIICWVPKDLGSKESLEYFQIIWNIIIIYCLIAYLSRTFFGIRCLGLGCFKPIRNHIIVNSTYLLNDPCTLYTSVIRSEGLSIKRIICKHTGVSITPPKYFRVQGLRVGRRRRRNLKWRSLFLVESE